MLDDTAEVFLRLDGFRKLSKETLNKLSSISTLHCYYENSVIHSEGEELEVVDLLLSGEVKFYKINKYGNEVYMHSLNSMQGQSMLSSNLYSDKYRAFANIVCNTKVEILTLPAKALYKLACEDHLLLQILVRQNYERTELLKRLISIELIFTSLQKVAYMMYHNLSDVNRLKRNDIAKMLNIKPETLSRAIKKLALDEIIEVNIGSIKILNQGKLRALIEA